MTCAAIGGDENIVRKRKSRGSDKTQSKKRKDEKQHKPRGSQIDVIAKPSQPQGFVPKFSTFDNDQYNRNNSLYSISPVTTNGYGSLPFLFSQNPLPYFPHRIWNSGLPSPVLDSRSREPRSRGQNSNHIELVDGRVGHFTADDYIRHISSPHLLDRPFVYS